MSDKAAPATTYTGPGSAAQGPVSSDEQGIGPEIYQMVLHDIIERSEFGTRKYGHPLRGTARVDFLTNLYQELLDALIYVRGEIYRRENPWQCYCGAPPKGIHRRECITGVAACGEPYPCAHAPDGGNHPEVPAQGA